MADRSAVLDEIAGCSDQIVSFAADLVAIATENPPGNSYPECLDLIAGKLEALGLPVELVELSADRTALISGVGEGPTFFLHGHYDVVPASAPGQFTPTAREGRLWGRGSADMKGGIASMVYALAAVAKIAAASKTVPTARAAKTATARAASAAAAGLNGRVELVLVPDEETGGELGVHRLFELGRLGKNGIGAVLGEPTSGVIWNAHRGCLTLRVTLSGKAAHVGLQHQGKNAFEAAIPVLSALTTLKAEVEQRRTALEVEEEDTRCSILMLGGEVHGGHQFNVVPDRFTFSVERRFNPEEDLEEERSRVLQVIREAVPTGVDVDIEVVQEGSSRALGEDAEVIGALRSAAERVIGSAPACQLCPGLLETRFYSRLGVPAIAYGPGELEVSHGPDESVEVSRLIECAKIYALTALDLLGAG